MSQHLCSFCLDYMMSCSWLLGSRVGTGSQLAQYIQRWVVSKAITTRIGHSCPPAIAEVRVVINKRHHDRSWQQHRRGAPVHFFNNMYPQYTIVVSMFSSIIPISHLII